VAVDLAAIEHVALPPGGATVKPPATDKAPCMLWVALTVVLSTYGDLLSRYRTAIANEQPDQAMEAAAKLAPLTLRDALDVLRLLSRKGDPRFERGAHRWLSRLVTEKEATLADIQVATAAMGALAIEPDSEQALEALVRGKPDGLT
jgi:hypothetical protein